jgi:hypothetical protein
MTISIPILTEYDGKGVKSALQSLKELTKGQVASAVSAGALVDIARRSITAANEDARSQRLLANTLRNTTGATTEQIGAVETNLQKLQYTAAIADDELRPALQSLALVTGDMTKSQQLLSTALDISAVTGRDVQTVALSLGRAYQGNVGALRRLGLSVSDTAIKSKDFQMAMEEIQPAVQGASAELAKGADGGWKKLGLVLQDTAEITGSYLNQTLLPVIDKTVELGHAANEAAQGNGLLSRVVASVRDSIIGAIIPGGQFIVKLDGVNTAAKDLNSTLKSSAANFRMVEQAQRGAFNDISAKRAADAAAAQRRAAAAAKALAEANKTTLANALQAAQDKLDALTRSSDDYRDSLRDTVSAYVSLSDAVSGANSSETAYNDALAERKAAYEDLAKLQTVVFDAATGKTTVADANDLADAMERVAKAEGAVATAQSQRKSYTQLFQEQITAAKSFGESLKTLVANGLQPAGLQQLLNLGPVAGAQVAKDILAGVGGLTVQSINDSLAGVAQVGTELGTASANQQYGGAILGAQQAVNAVQLGQSMNVTIQATSADPDKVVDALVTWAKRNGKLPKVIKVS